MNMIYTQTARFDGQGRALTEDEMRFQRFPPSRRRSGQSPAERFPAMTYTQAKMIIWNPESYDRTKVRAAVVFILACMSARREDLDRAMGLV